MLGGIFGHLFGLFTDADYYSSGDDGHTFTYSDGFGNFDDIKPVLTPFKITDITVGIGTTAATNFAALNLDHDAVRSHRSWCYRLPREEEAFRGERGRLRVWRQIAE